MGVPDLRRVIPATGCDTTIVSGPGNRGHLPAVFFKDEESLPARGVPDLHGGIVTARSDAFPIVRPRDRCHVIEMPFIAYEQLAACQRVDLDGTIAARQGQGVSIGRPGQSVECHRGVSVPVAEEFSMARRVHSLGRAIGESEREPFAIRRPAYSVGVVVRLGWRDMAAVGEQALATSGCPDLGR